MNSLYYHQGKNNVLTIGTGNSGSKHNIRWEVPETQPDRGTFTLLIRRGNDSSKRKQILETWNNVSLDPNSTNYIAKMIGDSYILHLTQLFQESIAHLCHLLGLNL